MAFLSFQLGDRSLVGVTHAEAVAALKAAGDVVDLLVVPAIRSQSESLCGRRTYTLYLLSFCVKKVRIR